MKQHLFDNHNELATSLAMEVAKKLTLAVKQKGFASIAFSGGSTPKLFLKELALQQVDWQAVHVTLVDERCVDEHHSRSNWRMLKECFLSKLNVSPVTHPLYCEGESLTVLNKRLDAIPQPFDCAVLGMGDDGHTASFFPHAPNLGTLIDIKTPVQIMSAQSSVDGELRLTWTLKALVEAKFIVLHICGEAKDAVFNHALKLINDSKNNIFELQTELPILSLLNQNSTSKGHGIPLEVYFSKLC